MLSLLSAENRVVSAEASMDVQITGGNRVLTNCSICKDDEKASVIYPLYFEASIGILPF